MLLLAAETLTVTVMNLEIRERKKILRRWLDGTLPMEELLVLKEQLWFQKHILKPPKKYVSETKKNN